MHSLFKLCPALTTAILAMSLSGQASAGEQSWVSAGGSDAANCTRQSPCRTFAAALSKTSSGGSIGCVDSGDYDSFAISIPVTIDCRGVQAKVRATVTHGIVITGGGYVGQAFIVRGLTVEGSPSCAACTGIRVKGASAQLEDIKISKMTGSGIEVDSSETSLLNVSSSQNAQHGLLIAPSGSTSWVTVSHSVFSTNGLTGIRANDPVRLAVNDSVLTSNHTHGLTAFSATASSWVFLERVVSTNNYSGGLFATGSQAAIYMSQVALTINSSGLYPPANGGKYYSFGNNPSAVNSGSGFTTPTIVAPL